MMNEKETGNSRSWVQRLDGPYSAAALRALKEMSDADSREDYENAEIVGSGREFWLGLRRVSPRIINELLRKCLVSAKGIGTGYETFTINEDGRCLLADPSYVPRICRPIDKLSYPAN